MIWYILYTLFFGSAGSIVAPSMQDLRPAVVKAVEAPARRARAEAIVTRIEQTLAAHRQLQQKMLAEWLDFAKHREVDRAELHKRIDAFATQSAVFDAQLLDLRFALREVLTPEEWRQVFGALPSTASVSGREDRGPVALHVDDGPAPCSRLVEGLVELSDVRVSVVVPLPLGIGMADQHAQPRSTAGRGPLQHLQVAIGVAESGQGSAADVQLDVDRLALLVVDAADFRQLDQHRLAVTFLEPRRKA